MSTQRTIESALRKFSQVMASEKIAVTSEEVRELVDAARTYLAVVSQRKISGDMDEREVMKIRVDLRNNAKSMLNRSNSLDSEAQQILREFIIEQPEYLPGDLKITADYFFLNSSYWSQDLARFARQP